jgi:ribosome biogenesis GTPase / thiamine phosphate phosphatase
MIDSFIDFERLRTIGLTTPIAQQVAKLPPLSGESSLMRVTEVQREGLTLHDGDHELTARALPKLLQALHAQGDALAVGDWVLAEPFAHGEWWVHTRVPPLTQIARRLHDGRDKVTRTVIVSNVDTVLLVMGLDLDFSLRRLERYVALVPLAGVAAVVVLTKADTCADVPLQFEAVRSVLPSDVRVVAVNALSEHSRVALSDWLRVGQTLVLLGSSGAGKSTLTNTLIGHEAQATGAARRGDGRGRHTTTTRCLRRTPEGACIIDTPGLRTLRLDAEEGALVASFADIAALMTQCRFRDCRHEHEPGCAVRDHVAPQRLRNYQKLLREAQRDTLSALQRKQQVATWKSRARNARMRMQAKRG